MLNKLRKGEVSPVDGKTAAVFTVNDADKMTPAGRKRIAKWLRSQADMLIAEGKDYAPKFRGRYLYTPNTAV